jgi:digeranylgeranylglycerophospholipid reductase
MKHREYDVIVIGAGPGGSVTARNLARLGHQVLLIEKRERIGYPVRCGEASTKLDSLEQEYGPIDPVCIETVLNGLYVYGPDGINLDAKMPKVGVMLNREKFDPWLAQLAQTDGAEVVVNARAESVGDDDGQFRSVSIVTPQGKEIVRARMVVSAEGVEARIPRLLGIEAIQKPGTTCTGVDIQVEGILTRPDYLTFWQGHDFINDGYIWSFPKQKSNVTNFGAGILVSSVRGRDIQTEALEWLQKLFPGAKVLSVVGGLVPVSGNLEKCVLNRFLVVGDAAHHTNPLTGGGIASAMRGGQIAADVIHQGLVNGDLSEKFLHGYETRCFERFGKEHRTIMKFRRFLLGQRRPDQIVLYKLIKAFLDNGQSPLAFLKKPRTTLRFIWKYLLFR